MAKGLMVCCSVFSPINDLSSDSSFISAHEKVVILGSGHSQSVDSWMRNPVSFHSIYNRLDNHKEETRRFEKTLGQQRITPGQSHFRISTRPPRMQG